jgi:hypothetical protein
MSEPTQNKNCKQCCMEIPAAARKCPYCQCWQQKMSWSLGDPRFGFLVFTIFCLFMITLFFVQMDMVQKSWFGKGEDFHLHANQLSILDSRMEFGQDDKGPTVAVVGRIRNDSDLAWKEVCFSVAFSDAQGKLTDAGQTREYYSYLLPAHEEIAFKVSIPREFPEESYASHKVEVVGAKDNKIRF